MTRFLLPLVAFIVLVGFLLVGLGLNPRQVPSPLIGKPAPEFQLEELHQPGKTIASRDNLGKVWLLNVWASWCVSCRDEHPVLVELARSGIVPVYGLNYKDERDLALQWLQQFGDPYAASARDPEGRMGIEYGVYGVPETYVIDKEGVIRYKQIGPVTVEALETKILPLVRELQG
ncbi:DsbE family thiol:disulfide interchange protein [Nitrosovibrio sp. Nv17]|jgi:cytochrome c biogenesis protein CcmG/thiol:disulfide interchange protein DsbE|uniref:DsbE family thiol:disulfide interchange protein n=1 Tax=Nitrosovibrio sp. Nv17 TaxID=1855339 RepID=UPI0009090DEF|nr:DsbE family thiol:disulfide interchange protein [Nitrosovibrio sp. Nv17]SFW15734.1 cytochrome c biogenesis protein CcmG, thiol:disulfide interchange protein DsbE [Nitrosovibrio sp. Nv17]